MVSDAWQPVSSRRPLLFFYPRKDFFEDVYLHDRAREYAKYRDVLVMPLRFSKHDHGAEDHDFTGGLYERRSLQPLSNAGLRRGKRQQIVRRAGEMELRSVRDAAGPPQHGKPIVYLGTYFDHYGHLLFESLGRSWILFEPGFSPQDGNYRYLFHVAPWCQPSLDSFPPAAKALCSALGLDSRNLILSAAPAAYRELIVPRAQLTVRFSANIRHGALLDLIGARLYPEAEPPSGAMEPVWLSRASLVGATKQASNERDLEVRLQQLGFRVVCPEQLELREQVRIFSEHRIFCGMMGSAFHTSLLARGGSLQFYVTGEQINSNFFLSDGIKGNRAIYCNALRTTSDGIEVDIEAVLAALRLCGIGGDASAGNGPVRLRLSEQEAGEASKPIADIGLCEHGGSLFLRRQDRVTRLKTRRPRSTPIDISQRPAIRAIHSGGRRGNTSVLILHLRHRRYAEWRVDAEGTILSVRRIDAHSASQAMAGSDALWVRTGN